LEKKKRKSEMTEEKGKKKSKKKRFGATWGQLLLGTQGRDH